LIGEGKRLTLNIQYPKTNRDLTKEQKIKRDKGVDRLPLLVKKLSISDPLLSNIPMVNKWSSYFYVEFPHTRREKFTLTYENRELEQKLAGGSVEVLQQQPAEELEYINKEESPEELGLKPAKESTDEIEYTKYKLTFTKREKYLYQPNKKLYK
jgi:hypothetical protein